MNMQMAAVTSSIEAILKEKVIHTEVQALRVGDAIFAAFPGEVFVETGYKLKQLFQRSDAGDHRAGNDYIGYIPPRKLLRKEDMNASRFGRPDST